MCKIDELINAINNIGTNVTLFDWIKLIISICTSVITCWVAILTFNLQKKIKKDDDLEKRINDTNHVSNVYYFLNDIINKMADIKFEYTAFNSIVVEGKQFMDDINYLRTRVITEQEFNMLRELYALYDGIKIDPKLNQKNFKILYKKVIDINVDPKQIPIHRNESNLDYIVSFQLLIIIKKLEHILSDEVKTSDSNIEVNFKNNNITIMKKYDNEYYLDNYNGVINGKVKRYEPVLRFERDNIKLVNELIYDGTIKNNKIDGKGKYYYYTSQNGFGAKIDSCGLCEEGINLDVIAQEIKSILISESSSGHFKATFDGTFKNGNIKSGILNYQLASIEEEKQMKIDE